MVYTEEEMEEVNFRVFMRNPPPHATEIDGSLSSSELRNGQKLDLGTPYLPSAERENRVCRFFTIL